MTRLGTQERALRVPPEISTDQPQSSLASFVLAEMAPRPGRLGGALRITTAICIIITIGEIFQLPDIAISAYVALILFKDDANATIGLAKLGVTFVLVGIFSSILVIMVTLSNDALRIPAMVLIAFGSMYLSRASSLGPGAFMAGLFMFISLSNGDNLFKGALGTYHASNLDQNGAPDILFMSPEEALLHNLLWLALAFGLGSFVAIFVSSLAAPDPERVVRDAIASRVEVLKRFCMGEAGARQEMAADARQGSAGLLAQNALAGKVKTGSYAPIYGQRVIAAMSRVTITLLALDRLPGDSHWFKQLAAYGPPLSTAEMAVRSGTMANREPPRSRLTKREVDATTIAAPLLAELDDAVDELHAAAVDPPMIEPGAKAAGAGFFKPDAFTNPAYTKFGLKVSLAATVCYIFMNLTDWSAISTCTTTCFVLATESVGQSFQKMMLRISGALVGAFIGFVFILLLMPLLTDIGQLLLVMAPVIFVATWIRAGSERISYAGQQFGFAFMLMMVQDYGPTTDFQTGRDRVVGILIGEIVFSTIFINVWPVSVTELIRQNVASAFDRLADLLAGERRADPWSIGRKFNERDRCGAVACRLRSVRARTDATAGGQDRASMPTVLANVQSLGVPIAVLARTGPGEGGTDSRAALDAHERAMAGWLQACGDWVRVGRGHRSLPDALPRPPNGPVMDDAGPTARTRALWLGILDSEIRETLDKRRVRGPNPRAPIRPRPMRVPRHASAGHASAGHAGIGNG